MRPAWQLISLSLLLLTYPRVVVQTAPPISEPSPLEAPRGSWNHSCALDAVAEAFARHPRTLLSYPEARKLVEVVDREASYYGVDPTRVLALIIVESGGQAHVISASDARGLMQILPETGQFIARRRGEVWRGAPSLHNPERNVVYGVWYYHHLEQTFGGNTHAAIAAYNWGPPEIQRRLEARQALPTVYSGKVSVEEDWLRREIVRALKPQFRECLDQKLMLPQLLAAR